MRRTGSLNHSSWECKYHVVFIPKYRKKSIFGRIRSYVGGNPLRFTDPFGLEVIYNDNTVLNAQVRDNLSRLDQALPGHDIIVTGGDRFRESDGSIRSASTGSIVDGASETSPHLYDRGARAADIAVPGATQQQIADAVNSKDFSTANTAHYDDGHTHVALPPFQSQNIRPEIREAFCAQNPRAAGCVPPPTDCP